MIFIKVASGANMLFSPKPCRSCVSGRGPRECLMHDRLSRRQILTAKLRALPAVLRPPWTGDDFEARCNACGECIQACPRQVLRVDAQNYPFVDYSNTGCDFCGECAKSCDTGAIRERATPWDVEVKILARCLAVQGTVCRSCEEICEEEAVSFRLGLNGKSCPVINAQACSGCGFCVAPCPTRAITIQAKQMEEIHA